MAKKRKEQAMQQQAALEREIAVEDLRLQRPRSVLGGAMQRQLEEWQHGSGTAADRPVALLKARQGQGPRC